MSEMLENSALTIGFIAAIVTGLGIIWLKAIKPGWRNARHAVEAVREFGLKLDWIKAQMVSNGGTTVKDQITRIDTEITVVSLRLEEFVTEMRTGQMAAITAAEEAKHVAASLVEARHSELSARLTTIENHLKPTGLPLPVTIADGPVPVTIVGDEA